MRSSLWDGLRAPSFRRLGYASLVAAIVISMSAMAGVAAGATLVLGKTNKAKAATTLTSSNKKKVTLALKNTSGAAAASFTTKKGKTPFTVSSTTKVKSLDADLLDGLDSSLFQRRIGGTCAPGSAVRIVNGDGGVSCQPVLTSIPPNLQSRIGGTCAAGSAIRVVNSDGTVTCQPVLVSVPPAWLLGGNAGTNPTADFLGTTDNQPLIIKTNGNEAVRVGADGNVGVGTAAPAARLDVAGANGIAVQGTSDGDAGVVGTSANADGVAGKSTGGNGVDGTSATGTGVAGTSTGGVGVQGASTATSGVLGTSSSGDGTAGSSDTGIGAFGNSNTRGVVGTLGPVSCPGTYGVGGCADTNDGVFGQSNAIAIEGESDQGIGMLGNANARGIVGTLGHTSCAGTYAVGGCGANLGDGVLGNSANGNGVDASGGANGVNANGGTNGVFGSSSTGIGVRGDSTTRGVVGTLNGGSCPGAYGVGGCGGATNDGVLGISSHPSGGSTAAAVDAINTGGGDIFLAQNANAHVARIDSSGKGFFDGGTQDSGADYAESIRAVGKSQLHPGDVLAIAPGHGYAVGRSAGAYSRLVVGIYSTKPALLAVGAKKIGDSLTADVPVAMMGVVPTKVTAAGGAIRPGDMLTTSKIPGYAMKAKATVVHGVAIYPPGTIVGKALEPLGSGQGKIEVMLMSR